MLSIIKSWLASQAEPGPKWGYIPCRGCGLNINALVVTQDGLCPPCRKDRAKNG